MYFPKAMLSFLIGFGLTVPARANSVIEETLFKTLLSEGVYLHRTFTSPPEVQDAGSFYLSSISCVKTYAMGVIFECSMTDEARPLEQKDFTGESARLVYEALAASGIKEIVVPFSHGLEKYVSATKLQCKRSGFSTADHFCQRLKPLI